MTKRSSLKAWLQELALFPKPLADGSSLFELVDT